MVSRKRNITIMKVLFLISTFMLFLASTINAGTIEVKQLGCGAEPACYTTINSAIFYAQPDDTIKVYPGRYEEAVVIDKNLILLGSGPQVTTIYTPSNNNGITINSYINATIVGFTITSPQNGIYINADSSCIVRNNIIVGNMLSGIIIKRSTGALTAVNNVISYNARSGIDTESTLGSPCTVSISSNVIYGNGQYGLILGCSTENISYNDIFANTQGNYNGCSAGTGDVSLTPLFIDPINGNYALQSTSPCKNAGRLGSADADPDGSRNDMGAYGGPDSASFWPYPQGAPIITNLTVTPTSVQQGGTITINATGQVW
jgi:nitrous oxidase accessory protein NosD